MGSPRPSKVAGKDDATCDRSGVTARARARQPLAAGRYDADDEGEGDREAQGAWIAPGEPRSGHSDAQALQRRDCAAAMDSPQGLRLVIAMAGDHDVIESHQRAMQQLARRLQAPARFGLGGQVKVAQAAREHPCEGRGEAQKQDRVGAILA